MVCCDVSFTIKFEVTAHSEQNLTKIQVVDALKANKIKFDSLTVQASHSSILFSLIQKEIFKSRNVESVWPNRLAFAIAIATTLPLISVYGAHLTFNKKRLRSHPGLFVATTILGSCSGYLAATTPTRWRSCDDNIAAKIGLIVGGMIGCVTGFTMETLYGYACYYADLKERGQRALEERKYDIIG